MPKSSFTILSIAILAKIQQNSLLDHLMSSEKWDWAKPELHLLLNSETKELDLDKWELKPTGCHEIVRFFDLLPRVAPNLEKISLGDKADFVEECPFHHFGDFIVHQVCQLKNLRYLSLNRACNLTSAKFIKITKNLKNLVCLKVKETAFQLSNINYVIICVSGAVEVVC